MVVWICSSQVLSVVAHFLCTKKDRIQNEGVQYVQDPDA